MPIDKVNQLKETLPRVRVMRMGQESISNRFARMKQEIEELKKRVRRLEGAPDSPPDGSPP